MTVDTTSGSALAGYNPDDFGDVGLEDIGAGDVVIPRLSIIHADGVFQDNLSKAQFPKLQVILLGLVKQRIMWDKEVDEGDKPMCKSPDFEHGFPQVNPEVKADKRFPWAKSNFNEGDFPAGGPTSLAGHVTLPCNSCIFKEWDKGDWKQPPCTEQHTYPLLYADGEEWKPAILTLQRTGIKPSRQYISAFAQSRTPTFTAITELSLTLQSRGSVKYSVPVFKKLDTSDRNFWSEYANQYRGIREYLRQPPRSEAEEGEVVATSSNVNTAPSGPPASAPAAPAAAAAPAPTPAPAASAPVDDDDLPF